MTETGAVEPGKRVSWVELYLDLVFVLAIGELAHLIVDQPRMQTVWIGLGLFVALWWTWVGFAVLYNRRGADTLGERMLFLTASLPAGAAAVAVDPAAHGHSTAFAVSLAITRLLLAVGHAPDDDTTTWTGDVLRHRSSRACLISAALFIASIWVPQLLRYVLWAAAILQESHVILAEDRQASREARRTRDFSVLAPADPAQALDAHHFSERFGLFIIILLGEMLVEAGQASVSGHGQSLSGWGALVAALLLAAALWWCYFDAAADLNLKVLELSGGSPTVARAIFAVGHMLPAFALLISASGAGLLLAGDAPKIAFWLPSIGAGMYLAATHALLGATSRSARLLRSLMLAITFSLGALHWVIGSRTYLWVLALWVITCAVVAVRTSHPDPERALEGRRSRRATADT